MNKQLLISILVLFSISLTPAGAPWAGGDSCILISAAAGTSEFVVQGETFRLTTPQNLSLLFEGVSPQRVWGKFILEANASAGIVRLVWLRHGQPPLTLHDRPIMVREHPFDSEEATGHNEK